MLLKLVSFFLFYALLSVSLEANSTKEGLTYLNTLRNNAGLISLQNNIFLEKAASSHAKYLIRNQTNGHYEKKGKYSYTGRTPSMRVIKAGYPSRFVMENLSVNITGEVKSIDNLFAAIYHRFVFLTLDKDEIGIGAYSIKKKRKLKCSYVYNIASSVISKLCKQSFIMENGKYYIKKVCKDDETMIPQSLFTEKKDEIRRKNSAVIVYPYPKQEHVWPAFYNEFPDPLPKYKVSGFPISVQFNPANTQKVKLQNFRLYDEDGKEIKKTKILQHKNDHNHLFTKFEFALMPLARLEFNTSYTVIFEAIVDGRIVKKQWSFKTEYFKEKMYRITEKKTTLNVKAGTAAIFYVVPDTRKDILRSYTSRGGIKVSFLDQNTIKVIFPKRISSGRVNLRLGKKKLHFNIE